MIITVTYPEYFGDIEKIYRDNCIFNIKERIKNINENLHYYITNSIKFGLDKHLLDCYILKMQLEKNNLEDKLLSLNK